MDTINIVPYTMSIENHLFRFVYSPNQTVLEYQALQSHQMNPNFNPKKFIKYPRLFTKFTA